MVCFNTNYANLTFNALLFSSGKQTFLFFNKSFLLVASILILIGIVPGSSVFAAGDAAAGKAYFASKCTKCHGKVSPREHDAYTDLDTTANPLSYYASDAAKITKAANEGYIIPEGNTDEKAKPGTSTNVPMKPWVGMGKDRLGEGNNPSQLALDMAAYFASFFDAPSSPKINDVTAKNASAIINFTTPKSELTITGYSVVSDPGNIVSTGPSSPITISGLTNGTSYKFSVSAISNAGTSRPSSSSNSVTPNAAAGPAPLVSTPQSAIPQTSISQTVVSQSSVAQSSAQKAIAPQSSVPQVTTQKVVVPQSSVPQTSVPQTSLQKAIAPQSSVPQTRVQKAVAPQSSVPATKVLKSDKPTPIPQSSVSQTSSTNTK
jgi:hypothetical protein